MLPQNLVRRYFRYSLSQFKQFTVHGGCVLVALSLTTASGCRSSFGPSTSDPSFDRLLELENGNSNRSPAPAALGQASNKVSQKRPGSSAGSRYAVESDYDIAAKQTNRRIELEEDFPDDVEIDEKLMRRTQLALRKSADRTPAPIEEFDEEEITVQAKRSRSPKRGSEDEIVLHFSDKEDSDTELTAMKAERRESRNELSPKAMAQSSTKFDRKPWDDSVQPAAHLSNSKDSGPDRSIRSPEVSEVRLEEAGPSTWQEHLRAAEELLRDSSRGDLLNPQERIRQAMISRLMSLSLNDREEMLKPIEGLQAHEQDYVNHQLSAIFEAIDPEANPVASKKWSLVMLSQRKANNHLASLSNLEINNLAFCTEVVDFGVTSPFSANKFTADQEVLLYLELDNFVSEKSKDGKGFETQLQGSYEIVDSSGRRIADQTLPADSHICKNIRRDYFIAYRVFMPKNITSGNYKLKLTIEDLKGRKFGQADIAFQIQ
jgi:hypothetical protein